MRATGIANTFGRGATIITPFLVVALLKSHGIGGVLSFMIGLLVVQILLVLFLGIEPKNRRLEDLEEIVRDVPVATPTQGRDFAE
jgi:putative MFS transporter